MGGGTVGFLQAESNDPVYLRKRISELEQENKQLKQGAPSSKSFSESMGKTGADWMNFGSGPLERPTTASQ